MNCFFDRYAESDGFEVVQRAYSLLRQRPNGYTITPRTDIQDIGGIPVLFGVKLTTGMEVLNEAAVQLEYEGVKTRLSKLRASDEPIFLRIFPNESESQFCCRLGAIHSGFRLKSNQLRHGRRNALADLLDIYALHIENISEAYAASQLQLDPKALFSAGGVVARMIPEDRAKLDDALANFGDRFWENLLRFWAEWGSPPGWPDQVSALVAERFPSEICEWKSQMAMAPIGDRVAVYERIWPVARDTVLALYRAQNYKPSTFLEERLVVSACLFLRGIGRTEPFTEALAKCDTDTLLFVLSKTALENWQYYTATRDAH